MPPQAPTTAPAELRWSRLAEARGLAPDASLCLALSGGADSVCLLHLLAEASPRPDVLAVHIDHGWRGERGESDARFCEALCADLGIPFVARRLALRPDGPSAEEVARRARYAALAEVAALHGRDTLLTAHHADDGLETFLFRWTRGTRAPGLYGPRTEGPLPLPTDTGMRVVRPFAGLRASELRAWLHQHGHAHREDATNTDPAHTRARVRHGLLPLFDSWELDELLPGFERFAAAARELEDELAQATAALAWQRLATPAGLRDMGVLRIDRPPLMELPRTLMRRVLWRLAHEACGAPMRSKPLEALVAALAAGRLGRFGLPRGTTIELRTNELRFHPAPPPSAQAESSLGEILGRLSVPGEVTLADGRRLSATIVNASQVEEAGASPAATAVVLDAEHVGPRLLVRLPRPGDRYHALGAPGSKPVTRFFADRGRPRQERGTSLLVCDELHERQAVWIPGFAPAHRARLRGTTSRHLRLELHPARGDFPLQHG